ncbi:uncharacterized protein LOC128174908 [Crassostrea angulata]|uniref:uncharacterized protein LOC128174908 n=1 Tax=Magallana angulata TaxID=2784310 RepID=UPI0022B1623B|nr:uncharacterized protein LOC128174908 [Crassostrea angulata]
MENKHQNLIKANYSILVKKMMAIQVAEHLYASNIITDEMRQQIEAEKTSYDQNRKLISIILRRGSRAFMGLRVALMKANQANLSRLLMNNEDDTKSEYEKKLAQARSLVIPIKERRDSRNESKKATHQQSQEPRCRISLDDLNDMFLTVMSFKGVLYLHIRHLAESHGRLIATKKGVTFTLARWLKFESLLPDIQDYIDNAGKEEGEVQWHIGGGVFVSLSPGYPTVDIRHFWKPDDASEPIPTKKGVTLNRNKLARLTDALNEIHECVPELQDTELCMFSDSHQNQLGMLNCPECTPFGYDDQNKMSIECNVGDLKTVESIESDLD